MNGIEIIKEGTTQVTKGEIDTGDYSIKGSEIADLLRDKNLSKHTDKVK